MEHQCVKLTYKLKINHGITSLRKYCLSDITEKLSLWHYGKIVCLTLRKNCLSEITEKLSVWHYGKIVCLALRKNCLSDITEKLSVWHYGKNVCLALRKNAWTGFDDIFWIGSAWNQEHSGTFWVDCFTLRHILPIRRCEGLRSRSASYL